MAFCRVSWQTVSEHAVKHMEGGLRAWGGAVHRGGEEVRARSGTLGAEFQAQPACVTMYPVKSGHPRVKWYWNWGRDGTPL